MKYKKYLEDIREEYAQKRKKQIRFFSIACCLLLSAGIIFSAFHPPVSEETFSQYGSKGEEVRKIQQKLTELGFFWDKIDGVYGVKTEKAVIRFQQQKKLRVDGKAGPETLKALGIYTSSGTGSSTADLDILARCVSAEARGEPYEGQVAVAAVILNRVKHPSFPNTIAGVIYQPYAFSSVLDGQINMQPTDSAKKAAKDAMNGWDSCYGSVYFFNPKKTSNAFMHSLPVVRDIGNHRFARYHQ